jgi:hypothetical protein
MQHCYSFNAWLRSGTVNRLPGWLGRDPAISKNTPIAIFAFRRPEHLRRTLTSLSLCAGFEESPVFVFCDGPRTEDERAEVAATQRVARELLGERAEYLFAEANRGLSRSVIGGINKVLDRYDRVIVVEEDLQLSPSFLTYMNHALQRFADNPQVFQISGYQFDVPEFRGRNRALFLPMIVSWGWGTWRRAWSHFDSAAQGWDRLLHDRALRREFNLGGAYDFATMLCQQMGGLRDSWAIRWYWSVYALRGLTLFPPVSFVANTGLDGTGTHGRGRLRKFSARMRAPEEAELAMPEHAAIDPKDLECLRNAIWGMNGRWLGAIVDRARWYRCRLAGTKGARPWAEQT